MLRLRAHLQNALLALAVSVGCGPRAAAPPAGSPAPSAPAIARGASTPRAWARPLSERVFERTAPRRDRGRYLVEGLLQCAVCHSDRDWTKPGAPPVPGRKLAGHVWSDMDQPWLVAPNLTPDDATGTGRWSDDMLARAIREGVGHDGRPLHPQMWYASFRQLSDDDVASVVVYLRSLAPIRNPLPPTKLPEGRAERIQAGLQPLMAPVAPPDLRDPIARGRYLVGVADCQGCHTAWEAPRNPGLFGGGNAIEWGGRIRFSSNLTPDPSGMPYYDEALFLEVIRTGRVKARALDGAMPWVVFRNLNDEDLRAIFAFLRTLPAIGHNVTNVDPPTECAVCKQSHGMGETNRVRPLPRAAVDARVFDDYVGRYVFEDNGQPIAIARDGERLMWIDGDAKIELVPQSAVEFRGVDLPVPIRFVRSPEGRVTHILWEVAEIKIVRQ